MTLRIAIAAATLAIAGQAGAETAQQGFLLPQVIVPDRVGTAGAGDEVESGAQAAPATFMLEEIRRQIGDRYVTSIDMSESESQRLNLLLNGGYLSDYTTEGSSVSFSTGRYVNSGTQEAQAEAAGEEILDGLAGLAMTPANIRALAMMSPEQLDAIAMMAEISQNPGTDLQALMDAGRLHGAVQRGGGRDALPPMQIGDGNNLALAGWYAAEHEGVVYIENDQYLGSRVGVGLGSVIGPFGPVMAINRGNGGVEVVFETGDRISALGAPDLVSSPGIPALGGDMAEIEVAPSIEPPALQAEIIMSDPAPVQTSDTVARPRPRPERVVSAPAIDTPDADGEG